MKTITLLNEKGGVGKTTLAVHLAMGLALRGKRVMLVDGDPQGHATVRCGQRKAPGLYDLLVRDEAWERVAKVVSPELYGVPGDVPEGKLWVLPSNVETRNIANSISDADLVASRLEELVDIVDVVLIDTSPTPSLLHGAFYTATDGILYPTMLTFTSFDGLVESIKRRQAADRTRAARWGLPEIEVLGIVPVAYREQTMEQQRNLKELHGHFGAAVWRPIAMRTIWTETEASARPVYALEPSGPAAADVWELLDRVEGVLYERA